MKPKFPKINDIDIYKGTFGVPEKRSQKNRDNLIKFFSEELTSCGTTLKFQRKETLSNINHKTFIQLARAYLAYQDDLESVFAYARKYKQAVFEITEDDLSEAHKIVSVKQVMGS